MNSVSISQSQARRFLIHQQRFMVNGSAAVGQTGVLETLQHLQAVQIDPLCAFERNHHQVFYNRVVGYRPEWLNQLLYRERAAFEYYCNALCILPVTEFPYFSAEMRCQWDRLQVKAGVEMLEAMQSVLGEIGQQGSRSSRDFASGQKIIGWWDNAARTKIEKQAMDYLHLSGKLLIASREGNQRSYDLAERLLPAELRQSQDHLESQRHLMRNFLHAYGLSQLSLTRFGWYDAPKPAKRQLLSEMIASEDVFAVSVEGCSRTYYCLAEMLDDLLADRPVPGGDEAIILAPLDNLLWDRDRLDDLFEFNYRWEVYTPVSKRQYGYYVVPLLYGEQFIGRIELSADKAVGLLRMQNLWLLPGHADKLPFVMQAVRHQADYLGLDHASEPQ